MQWSGGKFSTIISGVIIAFITLVFVVSGMFSPKSTRGLHQGAVAGTVNGDPISISEFNRALNQRMEFFKRLGGGKMTDEQLKAFHIREGVFEELVRRKLLEQEASKEGLEASDQEVMDQIRAIPAFQKDGQFDVRTYKAVLAANNYTPAGFERMVRTDLSAQAWQTYFQNRIRVSEDEIRQQFEVDQNKRDIKYVLVSTEVARQAIQVPASEVDKFLADKAKLNLAQSRYNAEKSTKYKNLTFDMVKTQIARDILAGEKPEELRKFNDQLADKVLKVLTASKKSDAKVNALLKPYKLEVKSTGLISSANKYIAGAGELPELFKDAFAEPSPIDGSQGAKPRKYESPAGVIVAVVTQTQKPDLSKLDAARSGLIQQIAERKQRSLYDEWLRRLQAKAKVDPNPAVLESDS